MLILGHPTVDPMPVPRHLIKLYPVAGSANNKLAIYKHALFGEFPYGFQCRSCDCLLLWAQPTPEFEVETLYLTAGIIIFDTLVPRAFQKYTTCMVFKAVQLFKKSATWFSENEGGGSKAVWNFSKNSSVLVRTCFPNRQSLSVTVSHCQSSSSTVSHRKTPLFIVSNCQSLSSP